MSTKTYTQVITNKGTTLTFGKYKGKTIREVLRDDPSYIVWLDENSIALIPDEISDEAYDKAQDEYEPDIDPYDYMADG